MKKYRIENYGCDDNVCFNIELTDEELKLVIKLFEENNTIFEANAVSVIKSTAL